MLSKKDTVSLSNTQVIGSYPSSGDLPTLDEFAEKSTEEEKGPAAAAKQDGKDFSSWVLTKYALTPKMSTYLVAWANGEFEHIESSFKSPLTNKTVPIRVYATKDVIHQAQLTLDVTAAILPIYEKIFDIPYPLAKLDTLVATDFEAGLFDKLY